MNLILRNNSTNAITLSRFSHVSMVRVNSPANAYLGDVPELVAVMPYVQRMNVQTCRFQGLRVAAGHGVVPEGVAGRVCVCNTLR